MPLGMSYDQWRTGEPDDRLPDCCEEQLLGVICERCNAEEPFAPLCPYIRQLEQDSVFEAACEDQFDVIERIEIGRDPLCGGYVISDRDIARGLGLDTDAITDAEITAALDAIIAAPAPVRPARLFDREPTATQVLEIVAAIFDHIEKEDD